MLPGSRENISPPQPHGELSGVCHHLDTAVAHRDEQLGKKLGVDLAGHPHLERPGEQPCGVEDGRLRGFHVRDNDCGIPGADPGQGPDARRAQPPLACGHQYRRTCAECCGKEAEVLIQSLSLFRRPAQGKHRPAEL